MPCIRIYVPEVCVDDRDMNAFELTTIGTVKSHCSKMKVFGYGEPKEFWVSVVWTKSLDRAIETDLVFLAKPDRTPQEIKRFAEVVHLAIEAAAKQEKAGVNSYFVSASPRDRELCVDA